MEANLTCTFCHKTSNSQTQLDEHIELQHKYQFDSVEQLNDHGLLHSKQPNIQNCDLCEQTFLMKELLNEHINKHHADITHNNRILTTTKRN